MDEDLHLLDPRFRDPVEAAEYLEAIRWPDGAVCAHCGETERVNRLNSKATTRRLWKCYACRKQFTVMVGTIFESSHVPLNVWLAAFYLLCSSKKGMSAHQLHRMLGVQYKTAWFLFHRIREAMKQPAFTDRMTGTVEVDETYLGPKGTGKGRRGPQADKQIVVTLVEREGQARSFRAANVTAETLQGAVDRHVDRSATVMTDEHRSYIGLRDRFDHQSVKHFGGEYVRGDAHTNTVESFFGTLKRGVNGTYHHVSEAHLPRYLAEFDHRWNYRHVSDSKRTVAALEGAEGKRLKYRESVGKRHTS